jgi:hypothetical protein
MALTRTSASGIENKEVTDQISVYPVPANDYLTIDLSNCFSKPTQIEIVNVHGQVVFSKIGIAQEKLLTLPVKNLQEGVYFANFQTKTGIVSKKIVIQK